MTDDDITSALTSGFVEMIQDPYWAQESGPNPVLQVYCCYAPEKNEQYCGSELNADLISLTLAD